MSANKIAVVTGANRGLGLGTTKALLKKGYKVVMGVRDVKKAPVLENAQAYELDVSSESSINAFADKVIKDFGHVDVLVNNAGIFLDAETSAAILDSFKTNTLSAYLLCQKFVPLMIKNKFGRVVNVSSGMGQLTDMNSGYPAYRISKTALNAVTKIFSEEALDKNVLVNVVCPGWVKTDMGGAGADRTIEEGISGIVWAATLPDSGPTGGFFRDGEKIDW